MTVLRLCYSRAIASTPKRTLGPLLCADILRSASLSIAAPAFELPPAGAALNENNTGERRLRARHRILQEGIRKSRCSHRLRQSLKSNCKCFLNGYNVIHWFMLLLPLLCLPDTRLATAPRILRFDVAFTLLFSF